MMFRFKRGRSKIDNFFNINQFSCLNYAVCIELKLINRISSCINKINTFSNEAWYIHKMCKFCDIMKAQISTTLNFTLEILLMKMSYAWRTTHKIMRELTICSMCFTTMHTVEVLLFKGRFNTNKYLNIMMQYLKW